MAFFAPAGWKVVIRGLRATCGWFLGRIFHFLGAAGWFVYLHRRVACVFFTLGGMQEIVLIRFSSPVILSEVEGSIQQ